MIEIWENLKIALRTIWTNKSRSGLTMLGIIIGVFAIVLLIGVGQGIKDEVANQVESLGTNLMVVLPGKLEAGSAPTGLIGSSTLKESDIDIIKKVEGVKSVWPVAIGSAKISYNNKSLLGALVIGSTPEIGNFSLGQLNGANDRGRLFSQEDVNNQKKYVVIYKSVADQLFGQEQAIGKKIMIGKEEFEVIGLKQPQEQASIFGSNEMGNMVIIPLGLAWDIFESKQISRIGVEVADSQKTEEVQVKVKEAILKNHQGDEDFSVLTQKELLSIFDQIINLLTTALTSIAAISLIVGGIGIMNIMLVSVTERTKEIGLRKAIGASGGNILFQFLIEALIISLLGGLIGVGLAFLGSLILSAKLDLPAVINLQSVLLALIFAGGVGIIFGVAPAIRASRLNPIDALRYE